MTEYLMHTFAADDGRLTAKARRPLCGAIDPGPVPFGDAFKVVPCTECMKVGPEGLPHEMTMEHHLGEVRTMLRRKLRGMSEADRQAYKEQIVAIAASGLADPPAAPALYETPQLLAALYITGAIRAGYWQLKRSGVRPTWALLEQGLIEIEMITVALVEGTPL